ncbi:fibronectin type III domain-containing protein [Knoellia sp. CPCC 206453]|uniref:fibronectin type III domain-containing protein n=1 Tax=Knoellia pratensis TaxID=3404796 RepID=UPI0036114A64
MAFRTKFLTISCGLALAASTLGVAQSHAGTPDRQAGATSAVPRPGGDTPPAAQVAGVAKALGISHDQARDRLQQQDKAHATYKQLPAVVLHDLAGHWFDAESGKLTVAVTSSSVAKRARAAGAEAKVVARSQSELDRLIGEVRRLTGGHVDGLSSFGVDVRQNDVLITVSRTKQNAETAAFLRKAKQLDGIRIAETAASPVQQAGDVNPGDAWYPNTESPCSVGFGATDANGGKHFVTAGHCTNDANQPAYAEASAQNKIGTSNVGGTRSVNGNEGDMGVVAVTEPGWTLSAAVNTYGSPAVTVTGSAEAIVGDAVCHSGKTSPYWECGTVTKLNQTVDYGSIVVEGLTVTTACSEGGDSGGAWLRGDKAVGLHEGGMNGNSCPAGDNAIFQPVNEALTKWGLTLTTGGGDTQAPTAPSALRSTSTTASSVSLSWTASSDNVGVTAYDVYNGSALATTVTSTTATVSGLRADTEYSFTVKARDAAGNVSSTSGPVTARTQPGDPGGDNEPPTTPGGLRTAGITSTTVSLAWDAAVDNVGVTAYDVYRGTTLATTSASTSATVTGLSPNTEYSFTVLAKDAAGNASKPTGALTVRTSGEGGGERTFSNETDYPIRDFQVTTSNVSSTATGTAAGPVTVKITATHPCQEDLQIGVRSPSGRYQQLKPSGDNGWNCTPFPTTRTFTFTPAAGEAARGTWQLRIADNGPGDTGVLGGWSITV